MGGGRREARIKEMKQWGGGGGGGDGLGGGRRHTASQENGQEKKEKMGDGGLGGGEGGTLHSRSPSPPQPFSLPPSLYLLLLTLSPRSACTRNVTISPFFCSLLSLARLPPRESATSLTPSSFRRKSAAAATATNGRERKKKKRRVLIPGERE